MYGLFDDLLWYIFLFCDQLSLYELRKTCKYYRSLIDTRYKPKYKSWQDREIIEDDLLLEFKNIEYSSSLNWFKWCRSKHMLRLCFYKYVRSKYEHNLKDFAEKCHEGHESLYEYSLNKTLTLIPVVRAIQRLHDNSLSKLIPSSERKYKYTYYETKYGNYESVGQGPSIVHGLIKGGRLEDIKAIGKLPHLSSSYLSKAFESGNLDMIKYIYDLISPCLLFTNDMVQSLGRVGDVKILEWAIKKIPAINSYGDGIFKGACRKGDIEVVKYTLDLIQHSSSVLQGLIIAMKKDRYEIIAYFYKEFPELFEQLNSYRNAITEMLNRNGRKESLEILYKANKELVIDMAETIVRNACIYQYYAIVEFMVNEINHKPTSFALVCAKDCPSILKLLLSKK